MLKTKIGNIELDSCIYNASGPKCTFKNELYNLLDLNSTGAVLTKSSTLSSREGNSHPRYYEISDASINSTGLANLGYKVYADFSKTIRQEGYKKPYFMSVAGLSPEDNIKIMSDLNQYDSIDYIELNLSCPNIIGKPQMGYDFEGTDQLLYSIFDMYDKDIGLKLPPYFELNDFEEMANVINKYPRIKYVTCINSLANGLIIDPYKESVTIKPKCGLGGIGGHIIKPIALSNVHMFYKLLPSNIDIIGCGGIMNGIDAFEHILAGASAVQIGTQFMKEGLGCFDRISEELERMMIEKNYNSIEDFKGKLQYIT